MPQHVNAPRPSGRGRKPLGEVCDRLIGRHFPTQILQIEGAKKPKQTKACVACNKRKGGGDRKRKETRFMCKTCEKSLCLVRCFEIYHTRKNYRYIM
ncbi:hypothetical protein KUTeg_006073 [Tegillarca granosa]|uniref:PiggyBac transposable element-derived protein 4 C-terminal zinc-finger domain-containing protein n=1 Tax=Tegillarca granosa TaxID=220873 RepID=A0ABQ9FFG2_TEGGR|nr:hypothetical protein KUTeg_006073 [Tegillarca granosa]